MSAAWESLHHAALEFTSSEPIKQRLIKAYSTHLEELDLDTLPPELRPNFHQLRLRLTSVPPMRGETAIAATVRKMSNDDASAFAQEIVELMAGLAEQRGRVAPARPRQVLSLRSAEG
ncbi:MAG: hypothetical protein H6R27_148 [Proteobacteria bacterium]|nr:hypothetical protein [Pseudomonadota bacterium]